MDTEGGHSGGQQWLVQSEPGRLDGAEQVRHHHHLHHRQPTGPRGTVNRYDHPWNSHRRRERIVQLVAVIPERGGVKVSPVFWGSEQRGRGGGAS